MSVCATCGHENQPGAKFCSECGVALAPTDDTRRQERKVVTVLFADLVGFTSRAERMDPEDVRELLSPYYARLRGELGDGALGVPWAHEDDPAGGPGRI